MDNQRTITLKVQSHYINIGYDNIRVKKYDDTYIVTAIAPRSKAWAYPSFEINDYVFPDGRQFRSQPINKLLSDPKHALYFLRNGRKSPWAPLEPIIATDASCSSLYAHYVLSARFLAGEATIASDPASMRYYCRHVTKEPIPVIYSYA